jgi:hypothetical protein
MRIRVADVLSLLANGLSSNQVLEELPDLEAADIAACLLFGAPGMTQPSRKGGDNREAKAGREVTRRCESSGDLDDGNP